MNVHKNLCIYFGPVPFMSTTWRKRTFSLVPLPMYRHTLSLQGIPTNISFLAYTAFTATNQERNKEWITNQLVAEMPQGYEAGCYLPSNLQRWPFKTLAWRCRRKPPFITEDLDLFPSRSINFLYLHLVRTMCFEQFVIFFSTDI